MSYIEPTSFNSIFVASSSKNLKISSRISLRVFYYCLVLSNSDLVIRSPCMSSDMLVCFSNVFFIHLYYIALPGSFSICQRCLRFFNSMFQFCFSYSYFLFSKISFRYYISRPRSTEFGSFQILSIFLP